MFKDEYIFEWEVPEKYIVHKVSVQTLLERKLTVEGELCVASFLVNYF